MDNKNYMNRTFNKEKVQSFVFISCNNVSALNKSTFESNIMGESHWMVRFCSVRFAELGLEKNLAFSQSRMCPGSISVFFYERAMFLACLNLVFKTFTSFVLSELTINQTKSLLGWKTWSTKLTRTPSFYYFYFELLTKDWF